MSQEIPSYPSLLNYSAPSYQWRLHSLKSLKREMQEPESNIHRAMRHYKPNPIYIKHLSPSILLTVVTDIPDVYHPNSDH